MGIVNGRTLLLIAGYIVCFLGVNLAMKAAAQHDGTPAYWWWFVGGNIVGFFCTVFMAMALRGQNPNLIYALCIGGGFCLLQIASLLVFKDALTFWQWLGIGLVGIGIICLQVKI